MQKIPGTGTRWAVRGRKKHAQASVLILVVWTLALFGMIAGGLGVAARQRLDITRRVHIRTELTIQAEKALHRVIVAMRPFWKLEQGYVALRDLRFAAAPGVSAQVGFYFPGADFYPQTAAFPATEFFRGSRDVQAQVNVNTATAVQLRRLFMAAAGVDERQADGIAQAILDWRDADDLSYANGAEQAYYNRLSQPYDCKNNALQSVDELLSIRGIDISILQQVRDYVTVYGSGRININTAPAPVLLSVGLDRNVVQKILAYRCGPDAIPATDDDRIFLTVSDIVAQLSQQQRLSAFEVAQITAVVEQGVFSVNSLLVEVTVTALYAATEHAYGLVAVFAAQQDRANESIGTIRAWRSWFFSASGQRGGAPADSSDTMI